MKKFLVVVLLGVFQYVNFVPAFGANLSGPPPPPVSVPRVAPALPPAIPPFPPGVSVISRPAKPFVSGDTYKAQFADGVKLYEFTQKVLKDVAKKPFIFGPEFLSYEGSVAVSSVTYKDKEVLVLLTAVLKEAGFELIEKQGYYTVVKSSSGSNEDETDFIYKVKARDLSYLSAIIQPLFKSGSFTYQRSGGSAPDEKRQGPGNAAPLGTSPDAGKPGNKPPVDDGNSAYSNLTRTNLDTFLYHGTARDITRLKGLLLQLDVPTPQVMVRAFFVEVSDIDSAGGGVSFIANLFSQRFGISLGDSNGGPNSLKFQGPNFKAVIAALDSSTSIRTEISPAVFTKSGQAATFNVASNIPSLGQIQQNGNGSSTQSIDRLKAGSILEVTPTVYEDLISINLHQEMSQPVNRDTGITGAKEIDERSLTSSFDIKPGSWLLIGGFNSASDSYGDTKIPFTGYPLSKTKSKDKRDFVLLLYVERA
jgi:general secretion pathway protein D